MFTQSWKVQSVTRYIKGLLNPCHIIQSFPSHLLLIYEDSIILPIHSLSYNLTLLTVQVSRLAPHTAIMTSLYKQSIPVLTKYLNNFAAIVRKGEELAKKKSLQPEELIKYRLISDMQG